jgi:hypothetical protein
MWPVVADFNQAFMRCSWAAMHFDRLQLEMADYLEGGAVSIEPTVDAEGNKQFTARVALEPPLELAFRTSDVIHHLRASLDHAVWALHPNGTKKTQFPVASSEEQWHNVQSQVAGLSGDVIDAIRQLQPFVEGGLGVNLVQLNDLATWDRHRAAQILVGIALSAGFGGFDLPADVPVPLIKLGPIEDGFAVGYWEKSGFWAENELPIVTFDIDLQFGPSTPAAGRPVRVALAGFQQVVEDALLRLSQVE